MKKLTAIVLSAVLCVGLLSGCGKSYAADESTVFVLKDGKVVSTDVEEFDTAKYDEASLEAYVKEQIEAYTKVNREGSVSLEKFEVVDGKANLTIEYASTADYMTFNGIELYSGTLAEALAKGYSFDTEFASVADGKATACDSSSFMSEDGLKVVIIKGNVNVNVPGTVCYATVANTKLVDESTIGIANGFNLITGVVEAGTEAVEPKETESVEAGTEVAEETVGAETETTELSTEAMVDFDFGEEEVDDTTTYTSVYTIIIYK